MELDPTDYDTPQQLREAQRGQPEPRELVLQWGEVVAYARRLLPSFPLLSDRVLGPASPSWSRMETVEVDTVTAEEVCAVCWDTFVRGRRESRLACGHVFHRGCLVPWLRLRRTCPTCRQGLA